MIVRTILVAENDQETISRVEVDGEYFNCILEDQFRETKVKGDTRIPAGRYVLKLRTWGGHHERYKKKFPSWHIGMIEITGINNFKDVLFHIGNSDRDTAGCPLNGTTFAETNGWFTVTGSGPAYEKFYKKVAPAIAQAMKTGGEVILEHRI